MQTLSKSNERCSVIRIGPSALESRPEIKVGGNFKIRSFRICFLSFRESADGFWGPGRNDTGAVKIGNTVSPKFVWHASWLEERSKVGQNLPVFESLTQSRSCQLSFNFASRGGKTCISLYALPFQLANFCGCDIGPKALDGFRTPDLGSNVAFDLELSPSYRTIEAGFWHFTQA